MPAPVIVIKDVGGYLADYQAQTAVYRVTGREVRLHECRSACTLALSLPNVCVYPDSVLKFHMAYDPRNHQPNLQISKELFDSYPAAVQARLGTLTREYRVLRGSELIELGVRNCNEPKTKEPGIMAASAPAAKPVPASAAAGGQTLFAGLAGKMLSIFGAGKQSSGPRAASARGKAAPAPASVLLARVPLPPPRPDLSGEVMAAQADAHSAPKPVPAASGFSAPSPNEAAETPDRPFPYRPRDQSMSGPAQHGPGPASPKIMAGARPILPPRFTACAGLQREGSQERMNL